MQVPTKDELLSPEPMKERVEAVINEIVRQMRARGLNKDGQFRYFPGKEEKLWKVFALTPFRKAGWKIKVDKAGIWIFE